MDLTFQVASLNTGGLLLYFFLLFGARFTVCFLVFVIVLNTQWSKQTMTGLHLIGLPTLKRAVADQ